MAVLSIFKLSEITRTEVFFTGSLYHACKKEKHGIEELLRRKLNLNDKLKIVDSGYEVCLFRDYAMSYPMKRENKSFEKQTFDNVFIFSDNSIVLIEAKAHQKFVPTQIEQMVEAANKIETSEIPISKVYLVGLCSSKYSPKSTTTAPFHAVITWEEVAACFSDGKEIFERANSIYNDRAANK